MESLERVGLVPSVNRNHSDAVWPAESGTDTVGGSATIWLRPVTLVLKSDVQLAMRVGKVVPGAPVTMPVVGFTVAPPSRMLPYRKSTCVTMVRGGGGVPNAPWCRSAPQT